LARSLFIFIDEHGVEIVAPHAVEAGGALDGER